jgi:hypothetical protein
MALKPEEVTRLQHMSDEMAKLIEDVDNTSSEAMVVYGKIGRACARALANVAATAARQTEREKHVQKFQTARETRKQKKNGTQAQAQAPQGTTRSGASTSKSA